MNIVEILDTSSTEGHVVNDQTFDGRRMILLAAPGCRKDALRKRYEFKSNGAKTVMVAVLDKQYQGVIEWKDGGRFTIRLV